MKGNNEATIQKLFVPGIEVAEHQQPVIALLFGVEFSQHLDDAVIKRHQAAAVENQMTTSAAVGGGQRSDSSSSIGSDICRTWE